MGRPFQTYASRRARASLPLVVVLWNVALMMSAIVLAGGAAFDWWTRMPTTVWSAAIVLVWCVGFVARRLGRCTDRWPA